MELTVANLKAIKEAEKAECPHPPGEMRMQLYVGNPQKKACEWCHVCGAITVNDITWWYPLASYKNTRL